MGSKTIRGKSRTSGSPRMQSPRLDGKISVASRGELWERAYSMPQCPVLFPSRMRKQENQPNLPLATQKPEQQRFCEFYQQVKGQDFCFGANGDAGLNTFILLLGVIAAAATHSGSPHYGNNFMIIQTQLHLGYHSLTRWLWMLFLKPQLLFCSSVLQIIQ